MTFHQRGTFSLLTTPALSLPTKLKAGCLQRLIIGFESHLNLNLEKKNSPNVPKCHNSLKT